jgi:hypothetical protein
MRESIGKIRVNGDRQRLTPQLVPSGRHEHTAKSTSWRDAGPLLPSRSPNFPFCARKERGLEKCHFQLTIPFLTRVKCAPPHPPAPRRRVNGKRPSEPSTHPRATATRNAPGAVASRALRPSNFTSACPDPTLRCHTLSLARSHSLCFYCLLLISCSPSLSHAARASRASVGVRSVAQDGRQKDPTRASRPSGRGIGHDLDA